MSPDTLLRSRSQTKARTRSAVKLTDTENKRNSTTRGTGKKCSRLSTSGASSSATTFSHLPPLAERVSPNAPQPVGLAWAVETGFRHVRKCSKKDTRFILKTLSLSPAGTPEEHNDAHGDLVLWGRPWPWLEKFQRAGGDFSQLSIKSQC